MPAVKRQGQKSGGYINHWYHECELKAPMSMPIVVCGAVEALDIALKEVILYTR